MSQDVNASFIPSISLVPVIVNTERKTRRTIREATEKEKRPIYLYTREDAKSLPPLGNYYCTEPKTGY